ncbi:lasso peptide biosynthesis B2 protein [Streptomyces sp. B1866]|uniref:lasso peptide biosynthesis B2 protein n=1 Tax=Streptomyces sp. B1866 TaxID=3075431 RepID=UPI002892842D|nr:lasso peptide biosynthesis B2 protein [Streptomyces sp. B1866]MDT3395786.1 lasso peptide biosynthesis B2 protein [Streptomyces sp. B1866]
MADLPRFATAPSHVRALDFEHVLALVDYRAGRVQCLLPAAAAFWHQAAATGRLDTMPSALGARLLTAGLLTPTPAPAPWSPPVKARAAAASWGSAEHPAGTTRPDSTLTLAASAALAAVLAIKRAGSSRTALLRITSALRTAASTARRPATLHQANAAVLAVRRAGWHSPARTACLEESAAAVLLLATRRLAVTWCHGVAPDPVRLHAWVQTEDGTPAAEPPSTLAYTPALTIGARHQHRQL